MAACWMAGCKSSAAVEFSRLKFMLPWSFSEEAAAEKYMPQLRHNMWVVANWDLGPLGNYRRRQMGRDQDPRRSALPAMPRQPKSLRPRFTRRDLD